MMLAFHLSMPNCPSWNGKWSGEGKKYVRCRTFRSRAAKANAEKILQKGYFHYSWSDGWGAGITVREVTPYEAAKLRKASAGFYGYDWMIDTIIEYGEPLATHQIPRQKELKELG